MANIMHKLFKNKSTQRFIVSLRTPQQQQHQHQQLLSQLIPSPIPQQTHHFSLAKPEFLSNPNLFLHPKSSDNSKSNESLKLYPNFPFAYFLNPISSTGFDPVEVKEGVAEAEDDDAGKIWADSVKKKRKRKMNKHKYKKLRKRLRRKTRS